jgi:tetratricopeptide (TPR) repeat protein
VKNWTNAALLAAFFILGGWLIYKNWKTDTAERPQVATPQAEGEESTQTSISFAEAFGGEDMKEWIESVTSTDSSAIAEAINDRSELALIKDETFYYLWMNNHIEVGEWPQVARASDSLFMQAGHWSVKDEDRSNALLNEAKRGYSLVAENQPDDLHSKGQLALIYIYHDRTVMPGVLQLKEIVSRDSTNELALYQLGLLSIQSGQYEKAVNRFEKLVSLHPSNPEYKQKLAEVQGLMSK